jgi:hypothetical protein
MGNKPTICIYALCVAMVFTNVQASEDTRLYTVSLPEHNGRQEDGGMVGNMPRICTYDFYRFEIDLHGQMFFKEAATCRGPNGQAYGGMSTKTLFCQLNADLHCDSGSDRFQHAPFTATEPGLSINGTLIAWKEGQRVDRLLPLIKGGAANNTKALTGMTQNLCPLVFGRLVIRLKRTGHISDANDTTNMTTCASTFRDICGDAAAKTRMVAYASASPDNKDIKAGDIDLFCQMVPSP